MIKIASPLSGWAMSLKDVPDPVFAERMLGDGFAVDPVEGRLVAPGDGIVRSVHSASHALTLELDDGPILLVHVGVDTVALDGVGFTPRVKDGDRVKAGDILIEFDLGLLARSAPSLATPVIVTNGEAFSIASTASEGPIAAGDTLLSLQALDGAKGSGADPQITNSRSLRLVLAHGLHARPAARLSKLAASFDARIEIVAPDNRVAAARSPVAILGLGLRHGAEFVIRAGGQEASKALDALVELLETGMGEYQPIVHAPAEPVGTPSDKLFGTAAVPGLVIGPAWHLKESQIHVPENAGDPEQERQAFFSARARLEAALEVEAEGNDAAAGIAAAHLAMVADPELAIATEQLIAAGRSAAFAWRESVRQFAEPLRRSSDARFAERLDDLVDLERRLLVELSGSNVEEILPPDGAILIAQTLYPSQLNALARSAIAGIATAAGGATSHAAIIAAGLGLPMVVGLGARLGAIKDGQTLILRGNLIEIATDDTKLAGAQAEVAARRAFRDSARARSQEPAKTADGTRIEVFANLGSVADAVLALEEGAEGCGLLRTEFLFLDRDAPPGEEEQRDVYQRISDELGERPIIVRTLDIGADKPASWLRLAPEDNPALGLRGIRLQLAHRDLLETQLRALLKVRSSSRLKIMLPMVSNLSELQETREILEALAPALGVGMPELGIMIETPAAALIAQVLAKEADFFSIGTNDLSQYALARDRTNPAVADGLDGLEPSVLRLIAETARGGAAYGRVTGVCGGLAAMPAAIPLLLGLGVTELSVPCAAIAETKAIVRSLDVQDCVKLAGQATAASDADEVRSLVRPLLEKLR